MNPSKLLAWCVIFWALAWVTAGFNVDIFDHEGNLLTSTKFHINDTDFGEWEDPEGSADYHFGDDGDTGRLFGEDDDDDYQEPGSPWEFDEALRKFNHMEYIYPIALAVPLNFPTRAGMPQTSPQDKIYPIVGSTFVLSFPFCSRHQVNFSPLGEASGFDPRQVSFTPTPHNQSLTLTVTNITEHLHLMVYVACMDITLRGRVFKLNDPEITYILAIRPNYDDLTWFVQTTAAPGSTQEFHAYINVTYERETAYWFNPDMFWLPINKLEGVPDQPIPFRESHSLNLTVTQCPDIAVLLHPFRPYRSPDGRLQVIPKPGSNDSSYFGFFDVTQGTAAVYMTVCNSSAESQWDRYSAFRANFRDMEFSASSLPFYDVPLKLYPDMVLWRYPDWAFVHTVKQEQVFPIARGSNFTIANISISAGLAGWRVQFTQDYQDATVNLTIGQNLLPDTGKATLNVSYDGQHLAFCLLNILDSNFGQYRIAVLYNNGTSRIQYWERTIYIRPHLRPQFFNPDVKAPYTHRFMMPWDRHNPHHRAMALQAALEGGQPEPSQAPNTLSPGTLFFFLVCAVAILGLSVMVLMLAMRYVRPIIIRTDRHEDPRNPIEMEEGAPWLRRSPRPWEVSSTDGSLSDVSM